MRARLAIMLYIRLDMNFPIVYDQLQQMTVTA